MFTSSLSCSQSHGDTEGQKKKQRDGETEREPQVNVLWALGANLAGTKDTYLAGTKNWRPNNN